MLEVQCSENAVQWVIYLVTTTVHDNCSIFSRISPSILADCCISISLLRRPSSPPPVSPLIVVYCGVFLWASHAHSLPSGSGCGMWLEPLSIQCSTAFVVVLTNTATQPMPPTPPAAKAFLRVWVKFGRVRASIWRLLAMVGVVDVSIIGQKWREKS